MLVLLVWVAGPLLAAANMVVVERWGDRNEKRIQPAP